MQNEENANFKEMSLGLIALPDKTFEHDLAVSDRYQNFSAELLRLSLAGIGAVGFLIINVVLSAQPNSRTQLLLEETIFGSGLFFSLFLFGLAAAFALAHRYTGPESKAYHLTYLRLLIRKSEKDDKRAAKQKETRDWFFDWSERVLLSSAILLWLAAMTLIVSFYPVLFKFRDF